MPIRIKAEFDSRELAALKPKRLEAAMRRIVKRANATALRDMVSESSKRVRARKRIKVRDVKPTLHKRKARTRGSGIGSSTIAIDVSGAPMNLVKYPHRQIRRGVSYAVNKGKRSLKRSAFIATMPNGHMGIFIRKGDTRLKIRELLGSRPVDALLHDGEAEAVQARGLRSFEATVARLIKRELSK